MPELRHININGHPYMATAVTDNRAPVFNNPDASGILLETILSGRARKWYYLLSFVIMPEHMHIVMIPREKDIPGSMKSIKGFSAWRINRGMGREGRLWQKGFYDIVLDDEEKVLRRIGYVEDNPVRKGLCERPEDYKYSSAGLRHQTDFGLFF